MVDAYRLRRIENNELKSTYRRVWWRNYIRGFIFSIPISILAAT